MLPKKNELLIMPLGGLEQIGANCTLIGNDTEWIIVDLGISFYDKLGIEVLTPDISFVEKVKDKIKGIFITHAHEDHIGAIPYLWPQLECPIYLTEFPAAVLKQKFKEYSWGDKPKINIVTPKNPIQVGNFNIEFVSLSHSILGACGIYIKTKAGTVFHTGDWKVDADPLLGDRVDEKRLAEIGKEGVDCLLCDSTNVLVKDEIGSESDVREALKRIVSEYKNERITVTCFASNVARMETIFHVAKATGRKIAVIGRSMHKMIDAVSDTSYFTNTFKANIASIVTDEEAASMPPSKVLLICTGSQGEARSALFRLARGENRVIKLGKEDVVLFSSKVIPGNELGIREMQNLLVQKRVEIVTSDTEDDIHVSGHPDKTALAQMYKWLRPKTMIPVHGDPRMLYAHKHFAQENGISEVIVIGSGDIVNVNSGQLEVIGHHDVTFNAIDGTDLIPITSPNIRDRSTMSYNGHVSVSILLSSKDKIVGSPDVKIHGIYVDAENSKKLDSQIFQVLSNDITKYANNIDTLKKEGAASIKKLITRHFEKKPIVTLHVHRV